MALSFLSDLGNIAGQVTPVAQGIGGLINAIRGARGIESTGNAALQPTASEIEYKTLLDAITNPESARFKSVAEQEYKSNVDAFLEQLRMLTQQGNRQLARGQRSTIFNPERADETINYLTTRGLPKLQQQSRESARNTIAAAATGMRGMIPFDINRQQAIAGAGQVQNINQQVNPLGRFGDILQSIQSLGKTFSNMSDQYKVNEFVRNNPLPPFVR